MADLLMHSVWGGVTDPHEHNPVSFRYLVHMDTGFSRLGKPREFFIDDIRQLNYPIRKGHLQSKLKDPVISASLIDQYTNSLFHWSSHGLILEASAEVIKATSTTDILIADACLDELSQEPTLNPDHLIDQTSPFTNNEVVIRPGEIVVAGLIYLVSSRYNYHTQNRGLSEVQEAGQKYSLPVITI